MDAEPASLRLDKWLWHARFFRTRTLAARAVAGQGVRVNGARVTKPATTLRPGDVLTFAIGTRVCVARVLALGTRRGPAPEARALYEDLSPPPPQRDPSAPRATPGGRPEKRARRVFDAARRDALD